MVVKKTGQEIKQEVLWIIAEKIREIRSRNPETPFNRALDFESLKSLSEVEAKVLEISPTKNGG